MEAKSRHDHSCRLGRRALIQKKKKKKKNMRVAALSTFSFILPVLGARAFRMWGDGPLLFYFFFSWILGEMPFIFRELGSKQKLVKIREQGSEKKINK